MLQFIVNYIKTDGFYMHFLTFYLAQLYFTNNAFPFY